MGDSIRSDVFPAKQYAGWDTMLILEEIVSEQHTVVTSHDEGEPPEKQPKLQVNSPISLSYLMHR